MPETAAGGRVGIVNREGEALGVLWRSRPRQRRRDVAARAAKAAEDLLVGDLGARRDVRAGQGHRLGSGDFSAQEGGEKRECGCFEHKSSVSGRRKWRSALNDEGRKRDERDVSSP